jgi:hypothetical protein
MSAWCEQVCVQKCLHVFLHAFIMCGVLLDGKGNMDYGQEVFHVIVQLIV